MKKIFLLFSIIVGIFFLDYIFKSLIPLADDIITYYNCTEMIKGNLKFSELLHKYLIEPGRMVRPLSGVFMALFVGIAAFLGNAKVLYMLSAILFSLFIFTLYYFRTLLFSQSKEWYILFLLLVFVFPFSSSTLFAPMLSMISFLGILYIISLYCISKSKLIYFFISGFLALISALTVEYYLPLLLINALVIYDNQKRNKYLKILLATVLPIILFIVYRQYIAPKLFQNFYDYSGENAIINSESLINAVVGIVKTYTLDYVFIIKRAFITITFYTWADYITLILIVLLLYIISKRKFEFEPINHKKWIIYMVFFALSYFLFFISKYKASAFEFYNRTMGLARVSNALMVMAIFAFLYSKAKKASIQQVLKSTLLLFIFINAVVVISEKNAWTKAGKFNWEIADNIQTIMENKKSYNSFINYQKYEYPYWVADEPTIRFSYEFINLFKLMNKPNFKTQFVTFNDQPLYCIFNKPVNGLKKDVFNYNNNILHSHNRNFTFPLYIYFNNENSLVLINNYEEFETFLNQY